MAIVAGVWGKFEPGSLGLWQLFRNDRLGSRLVACLSIFLKCCCRSGWERPSLHRRLCWDLGVLPTYQLADAQAVVVSQCVYQENGLLQVSQGDRGNLEIAYQDMRLRDHRAFRPILVSSFVICSVASTALAAFGCMCYGALAAFGMGFCMRVFQKRRMIDICRRLGQAGLLSQLPCQQPGCG